MLGGADPGTAAVAARPESPDRAPVSRWRRAVVLLAAPVLASIALFVVAAGQLDAPFTPSFSSFNTAVWGVGADAVVADGWWDSRLGATAGTSGADVPYAHHPPLVRVQVGVAEAVLGDHHWVDRLPALVSSFAAIWLCWGWLGACGFRPGARSFGVLVLGGTAYLHRYGLMLNMEGAWLPLVFALLWAWQRAERRGGGFWSVGLLALWGATASHEGIIVAGGFGAWSLAAAWRQHRRLRPHEAGVVVAAASGAAMFVAWVLWATGGIADLTSSARQRSGGGVGWWHFLGQQATFVPSVLGLLGIVSLVAGLVLVRRRPELIAPVVIVSGTAVVYAVGFREGASIHDYWNVALVPVAVLGAALLADRVAEVDRRAVGVLCVIAAVLMGVASIRVARDDSGDEVGLLARRATTEGVTTLYSTQIVSDWLTHEFDGPAAALYTCAAVDRLAASEPDATVLTAREWAGAAGQDWDRASAAPTSIRLGDAALVRADTLAAVC